MAWTYVPALWAVGQKIKASLLNVMVRATLEIQARIDTLENPVWHTVGAAGEPAFQNGWSNYGAGFDVAQFALVGKILYIRGGVKSGTVGTFAVFTLPAGFRPNLGVALVAFSDSNTYRLDVTAAGQVQVKNGVNTYASLACTVPLG